MGLVKTVLLGKLVSVSVVAFFAVLSGLPAQGPTLQPPSADEKWPGIAPLFPLGEPGTDPLAPYQLVNSLQMAELDRPVPASCAVLPHFDDEAQLAAWLPQGDYQLGYSVLFDGARTGPVVWTTAGALAPTATLRAAGANSLTNNQVAGVDEADTTKTDGLMLYTRSGSSIAVVKIFPVSELKVTERIAVNGTLLGLLIDPTHLVAMSSVGREVTLRVYDRTQDPLVLEREVAIGGGYVGARAIGDHVFLVTSRTLYADPLGHVLLPSLTVDAEIRNFTASDVAFTEASRNTSTLVSLLKMNLSSPEAPTVTSVLSNAGGTLFVSSSNLYLAGTDSRSWSANSTVLKIPLRRGGADCAVQGMFQGYLVNQYSLDEFAGNLRIASTVGEVARSGGSARNLVTVLSDDLKPLGLLDDLAPGEKIYSARFMGERLYLVTFKKVDPLFVIDLTDPAAPTVLGYLKIPGFSDYMHPIAPNLLVGVGLDTVEAEGGGFAWFQGVKLSLFDVADVEHPREVAKLVVGDRGSYTPVSEDPHAFTWVPERSLLILPIHVFEVNESGFSGAPPANAYGEEAWTGAYFIRVTAAGGFEVVRKYAYDGDGAEDPCWSWGCSWSLGYARSFAVGSSAFLVAPDLVVAVGLENGAVLGRLSLAGSAK